MDYTTPVWLFLIHLTALLTPAQTLAPDYISTLSNAMRRDGEASVGQTTSSMQRHFDIAIPQRLVAGSADPRTARSAAAAADASPSSANLRTKPYLEWWEANRQEEMPGEIRYKLTAFGKDYVFILGHEDSFLSPALTIEHHVSSNRSTLIPNDADLAHCYYRGIVEGDPISTAVFDLCHGIRGVFQTRNDVFLIQPLLNNITALLDHDPTTELRHLIVNHLATLESSGGPHCALDDTNIMESSSHSNEDTLSKEGETVETRTNRTRDRRRRSASDDISSSHSNEEHTLSKEGETVETRTNRTRHRGRRSTSDDIFQGTQSYPRYVEMMITADKSMLDYHGSEFEVKRYLQTVIGVVHGIFRNPELGNSVEIILTGIKILKNNDDLKITNDAHKLLRRFCRWQHKQNVEFDSDARHYDTAMLITRKNICNLKRPSNCQTLGLADLGKICIPEKSCSIVEDNGLGVAFTIAHELGHIFNIDHDVKAKLCLGEATELNVMARSLNSQSAPWGWSSCSRQAITNFLDQGHDSCLLDRPQYQFKQPERLSGEIYGPDEQCRLSFGKKSGLCVFKDETICRVLWCAAGEGQCRTLYMPWADGSECGHGKWCMRGACVAKQSYRQVDGGWSNWSSFGSCSRTCGGGVSFSSRTCNNPKPAHGGRFCIGVVKRFKSCQTQDCPPGGPSFRETQCAAFNGRRGNSGSLWLPQDHNERTPCLLTCARSDGGDYITTKVIDGTKCGKKSFDICVNRLCRLAGCDNILNSDKQLDECGVCGGNNSTCQRITKVWEVPRIRWGYNDVATFYPGYTKIRIEQTTPRTEHRRIRKDFGDDNYLVLRDEVQHKILNTGYSVQADKKVIYQKNGLEITYSGWRSYPEYINIEGTLKRKIHLQILAVEEVIPPRVTYSYITAVEHSYSWDNMGPWSACSHECQGKRERRLSCKREDDLVVLARHCDSRRIPAVLTEDCHTHCLFKWMIGGKGPCKPGCGPGTQKILYNCVKHEIKVGANLVRSNKDCRRIPKPRSDRPCTGTCDNMQWAYSKWSTCSKTCGGGVQTREIFCIEKSHDIRKMPHSMCSRIPKRHLERTCNTDLCPAWRTGRWDRCSASCGEGVERRQVSCVLKRKAIEESACNLEEKPEREKPCQMKACPHWQYDEWSDCSASCGSGDKIRVVQCVDAEGQHLGDEACGGVEKPVSREECTGLPDCVKTVFFVSKDKKEPKEKLKWVTGKWSECSVTCGTGRQVRRLKCLDSKNKFLDNNLCENITKPATVQDCAQYCGIWRSSDWTKCSSHCGEGTQRRQVKCFNKSHGLTDDDICDPLRRPPETRRCTSYLCAPQKKTKPKAGGRWKTGSWSKCSRTCENGRKRRMVICVTELSRRDITERSCKRSAKPPSEMSCNLGKCPYWRVKQWSKCSKTCGLGIVTRSVYCADQRKILANERCDMKLKPTTRKSCFVKRCVIPVRWAKGEWQQCSVKCGRGVKQRRVWCENYDRKRLSSVHCQSLKRKPRSMKECRRNTCGVWETGPWATCSKKCDAGKQVRSVRCRRINIFVGHEFCVRKEKPVDRKACLVRRCRTDGTRYRWFSADWGQCSTTCGPGIKSRMVVCTNQREQHVSHSYCDTDTRPPDKAPCRDNECPPDWDVGDWSECSTTCDHGVQTRTVTCSVRDHRLCDVTQRPSRRRRCNLRDCGGRYVWKTGPWSQCPVTCGEGQMRRAVKCLGDHNYITSDLRCLRTRSIKPDDSKTCSLRPCLPKRCTDIQRESGKQEDGEFILTINHKKIRIYCHGMLTDNPKEYITLAAGLENNFAEYYHRSLKNPNECPYNGERRDDCPKCHSDIFSSSGGTYYSKVRLDISRMALIGNDFTFATTRGNQSSAFGTAGDCYSKARCPQGRFSVDLSGTRFFLAPEVYWVSYGYYLTKRVHIQKSRQIVSGMCGGYCGICRPHRSLRVTVS